MLERYGKGNGNGTGAGTGTIPWRYGIKIPHGVQQSTRATEGNKSLFIFTN